MFKRFKSFFRTKDEKEQKLAQNDFDELMKKVDDDDLDLTRLEHHVREEFDGIGEDVEAIQKEVDEVIK